MAGRISTGVSFHAYDCYTGALGCYANGNRASAWNTAGPVSIAKVGFVQGVLAACSVTGKFLMNIESAMICGAHNDPPGQPPCQDINETIKAY